MLGIGGIGNLWLQTVETLNCYFHLDRKRNHATWKKTMWFTDLTLGGQKSVVLQDTYITILKATTHILACYGNPFRIREL